MSWTQTIANYIKSLDSNHLVMDGNAFRSISDAEYNLTNVDIYSNHYYSTPNSNSSVTGDANSATAHNKAFNLLVGIIL